MESARVMSYGEMAALSDRWLNPEHGVLARLKDDPYFALAKPSARKLFTDMITNRVGHTEREWREVWALLNGE